MSSEGTFEVPLLAVCEYATMSVDGRLVLAGLVEGEVTFSTPIDRIPSWTIILVIAPKADNFEPVLELRSPGDKVLMRALGTGEYVGEAREKNRIIAQFDIPPMLFAGMGSYTFQIRDGSRIVAKKTLSFTDAPGKPPLTKFNLQLQVADEFHAKDESKPPQSRVAGSDTSKS